MQSDHIRSQSVAIHIQIDFLHVAKYIPMKFVMEQSVKKYYFSVSVAIINMLCLWKCQ